MYQCQYCNRPCKNLNSLKQHEIRCSNNPDRINVYKDGFNINNKGINKCQHIGKICITNGKLNRYINKDESIPEGWSLGSFTRGQESSFKGKHHSEHTRKQIGKTMSVVRTQLIADGKITPNTSNRYVKAYIQYKDGTRKLLRSSYELIVAIFLDLCNISFDYEVVRVPYTDGNGIKHSYISDFSFPDSSVVLDIKGFFDEENIKSEIQIFKAAGYDLRFVYEADVLHIKDLVSSVVDIESILSEARKCSALKQYYVYQLHC